MVREQLAGWGRRARALCLSAFFGMRERERGGGGEDIGWTELQKRGAS